MEISAALAADLKSLTDALENPGVDIETQLRLLSVGIRTTVSSFCGVTMIVVIDGFTAAFTVTDHSSSSVPVLSSLRLPLDLISPAEPGSAIVFYATNAGAFVDLAADLAHALVVPLESVAVDTHLDPPEAQPSLKDLSRINQAIGVLLDRGYTATEARTELTRLATAGATTIAATAERIVTETASPIDPTLAS
ncbi:MAG: hypothetical protein JWM76_2893 [Pseudonocardiales bacterium]|nr:hypothetical protein [Pseudonocardiales bacterium]